MRIFFSKVKKSKKFIIIIYFIF